MSIKIIGLTGRTKTGGIAGAGKTTVALEIQRITKAVIYGFSDPIYNMIKTGFGIDGRSPEWQDRERKIAPIEWLSTHVPYGICRDVSLRYLLEKLGTEWGREQICDDVWIRVAEQFVKQQQPGIPIVIHDVRFKNEAEWIKSIGGVVVSVIRDDYEIIDADNNHASNKYLPMSLIDYSLLNDRDIDWLRWIAYSLIKDIGFAQK